MAVPQHPIAPHSTHSSIRAWVPVKFIEPFSTMAHEIERFNDLYRDPCSYTAMGAEGCYGVLWDSHGRDWFIELYRDPYPYTAMGAEGCYGVLWDSHGRDWFSELYRDPYP